MGKTKIQLHRKRQTSVKFRKLYKNPGHSYHVTVVQKLLNLSNGIEKPNWSTDFPRCIWLSQNYARMPNILVIYLVTVSKHLPAFYVFAIELLISFNCSPGFSSECAMNSINETHLIKNCKPFSVPVSDGWCTICYIFFPSKQDYFGNVHL